MALADTLDTAGDALADGCTLGEELPRLICRPAAARTWACSPARRVLYFGRDR